MIDKLLILPDRAHDADTFNLAKMSEFFGIHVIDEPSGSSDYAVAVAQRYLDTVSPMPGGRAVLVYDCRQDCKDFKVAPANDKRFYINTKREITRQLSGLSVSAPVPENSYTLTNSINADSLIQIGEQPYFIHKRRAGCDWFFLGGGKVADLDSPVTEGEFNLDGIFAEIIPFAMFFQYIHPVSRDLCANLIIDDPSLTRRYGFIDYQEISNLVRKENFAVTIAFIPWNYKRSNRKTVDLFRANSDRLSICVHGCDHGGGEFGSTDSEVLSWKCSLARERMLRHCNHFGLPYDNVVVFPQGIFSERSMIVLRDHGFAAAVNSEHFPNDYSGGLKLHHMISPWIDHYGLPLMLRRYPDRIEDFACDLFFGRPALIVRHNADFADGWDELVSFIGRINRIEPNLQWMPLGKVVDKMVPFTQPVARDKAIPKARRGRYTIKSYLQSALRRSYCDIRDNYLCKSRTLRNFLYRK